MPEAGLHFAYPWWLAALPVPLLIGAWLRWSQPRRQLARYRAYAEALLLPHLLGVQTAAPGRVLRHWLLWSLVWVLLTLALAAPRWGYHDLQVFRPGNDLIILLDISRSMDVTDVAPSRLARARQEIEDLIDLNHHTRIGLIAFATVAHVVAPLTEDAGTLRQQLPAISSDLIQLRGSRLTEALLQAQQMLAGQPVDSGRHLLVISDGDFADRTYLDAARTLAAEGIQVHVLAIGTAEGATVPDPSGRPLRHPREGVVISRLDSAGLQALATAGQGWYGQADFDDADTQALLAQLAARQTGGIPTDERTRVWHHYFFVPLGGVMLLSLARFRRQAAGRRGVAP